MATPVLNPEDLALVGAIASAMDSYASSHEWGLEFGAAPGVKGKPRPSNPKGNPRPETAMSWGGTTKRVPRRRTTDKIIKHLRGERAMFDYGRPDRRTIMFGLDLDGQPGTDLELGRTWARACFAKVFPTITPFIEPSRGGHGLYVRFGVQFPPATDGPARRRCERELQQRFAEAFTGPPAGLHFDRIIGTTTFKVSNQNFDAALAASIAPNTGKITDLIRLEPGEESIVFDAAGFANGIIPAAYRDGSTWVRHEHAPLVGDRIPGLLDRPRVRDWSDMTEAEVYERHKNHYGLGSKPGKFQRRDELEPKITKHGQLGTSPCYGAWSGNRPDNVLDYLTWFAAGDGVVSATDLKDAVGTAWQREPVDGPHADYTPSPIKPGSHHDWSVLLDEAAEPEYRYAAGGRLALRQSKGDIKAANLQCLDLFEMPGGPSDGPRHPEREDRAERFVGYAAQTYDVGKAGNGGVWFGDHDPRKSAKRLRGLISKHQLAAAREAQGRHRCRPLTYDMIGHAACFIIKNACTGSRGHVPVGSISAGMGINGSTASAIMNLLESAGLIEWTGEASVEHHQCRTLMLVGKIMRPEWAEGAMGDDVWRSGSHEGDEQQHAQPNTAGPVIAIVPPMPTPPDKSIRYTSINERDLMCERRSKSVALGGAKLQRHNDCIAGPGFGPVPDSYFEGLLCRRRLASLRR